MADKREVGPVRVDLEEPADGDLEAPEVSSSSTNVLAVALGLAIVVAVGVGIFLLRPEPDTAADGTPRESADALSDDPGQQGGELGDDMVVPTPITTQSPLRSIVAQEDGFLALGASQSSPTPVIFGSLDGVEWERVDVSVTSRGFPNEVDRDWFDLTIEGGLLQLRGETPGDRSDVAVRDVFVSENGMEWEQVDGIGSLSAGPVPEALLTVRDDHYFSQGLENAERLNGFLLEHSALDPVGAGYCFISTTVPPSDPEGPEFRVRDCLDLEGGIFLEAANVSSSLPTEQVLECASVLADGGFEEPLIRQDVESGERTFFDLGSYSNFVSLPDGSIALVDPGFSAPEGAANCEGIVELGATTEPAVLIVGAQDEVRWPLPDLRVLSSVTRPSFVLGAVTVSNGDTMLIADFGRELWALDIATGEWSFVIALETESSDSPTELSESGTRVYSIIDGSLVTVDISENDEGALALDSFSSIPIAVPAGGSFEVLSIVHANDDAVFVESNAGVVSLPGP